MILSIFKNRLKGKRWLLGSRGKIARVLLGSYEPEQTALFEELIKPGAVVFDIGAHAGYYSLLAGVLTGPAGKVVAFEPNPKNHFYLKEHMRLNDCRNVMVVESAVGDREGEASFAFGPGSGTGKVAEGGKLTVSMVRLDDFARQHNLRPHFLKIDVEGGEAAVLKGGAHVLQDSKPVIFLSTHGADIHRECLAMLKKSAYQFRPIVGSDVDSATEVLCLPPS